MPPLRLRFGQLGTDQGIGFDVREAKVAAGEIEGRVLIGADRVVAGDRHVIDGRDVDGHGGGDGARTAVVDAEIERGKRQTVLVGRGRVDEGIELSGGEGVAVVDHRAAGVGEGAAVEAEVRQLGTDQGIGFDVREAKVAAGEIEGRVLIGAECVVAGDRHVVDGRDVDGHGRRHGARTAVVDAEIERGKRQTVLVGRGRVDEGIELSGGEGVAVVDRRATRVSEGAAVEAEVRQLGTDQGIGFDVREGKVAAGEIEGRVLIGADRIVAGDRHVIDGRDVDGHGGGDGARATVVDAEIERGKRQTVLVGRGCIDEGIELSGGEGVAVVDRRATRVSEGAAVEAEVRQLGTDQGVAFDVREGKIAAGEIEGRVLIGADRVVAGHRHVIDGRDVDGHGGGDGARATVVDAEIERGKGQTVLVGRGRVDESVELGGGERIAVVDGGTAGMRERAAVEVEAGELVLTRASPSTSVKVKSPLAKLSGVSSLVLSVLLLATGTSLTA